MLGDERCTINTDSEPRKRNPKLPNNGDKHGEPGNLKPLKEMKGSNFYARKELLGGDMRHSSHPKKKRC